MALVMVTFSSRAPPSGQVTLSKEGRVMENIALAATVQQADEKCDDEVDDDDENDDDGDTKVHRILMWLSTLEAAYLAFLSCSPWTVFYGFHLGYGD